MQTESNATETEINVPLAIYYHHNYVCVRQTMPQTKYTNSQAKFVQEQHTLKTVGQNAQLAFDNDFGLMGTLNKFYEQPRS